MATFKVNGMKCGHCSASVTKALLGIDGVSNVQVNLETGEVSYAESKSVPVDLIKDTIKKIGFEVVG
ncbi:MAG: heavy-metal-associated domain-containing protein [Pseudomonadota bacterium]